MASLRTLALLAVISALAVGVKANPIQSTAISGESITNSDGSVKLVVDVTGGNPSANNFSWKLPSGTLIQPGQTSGTYEAREPTVLTNGGKQFVLILKGGYLSTPQSFTFRAEATSGWWRTFTFSLPARLPTQPESGHSTLTTNTDHNADGSVTLKVTVSGGSPAPDSFQWTLPSGDILTPGKTSGAFQALVSQLNQDGTSTYTLELTNGLTSSQQNVTFRAEVTGGWWRTTTFTLNAENGHSTLTTNTDHNTDGSVTLKVTVSGGSPAPDSFQWTLPRGDILTPGKASGAFQALVSQLNQDGTSTYTLELRNGLTSSQQNVTFRAEVTGGWWRTTTFTLNAKTSVVENIHSTLATNTEHNADGSVTLKVTVSGGSPAPDSFQWTLPSGDILTPGNTSGAFQALVSQLNQDGTSTYTLELRNGLTSSQQSVTFRAEVTGGWWRTTTFTLNAENIHSTFATNTDHNADGSVTLKVTVSGGSPAPDSFQWTLPNGDILTPGNTSGAFQALVSQLNQDGISTYTLELRNGLTSSQQSVTFRAEVTGGWWRTTTFTLNAKTSVVANQRGRVSGSLSIDSATGVITVVAEVVGGIPKPTTYLWTVQQPDGSFVTMQPGEDQASPITINDGGNLSTTLTITEPAVSSRTFTLDVSSYTNGSQNWGASRTWTVSGTASR